MKILLFVVLSLLQRIYCYKNLIAYKGYFSYEKAYKFNETNQEVDKLEDVKIDMTEIPRNNNLTSAVLEGLSTDYLPVILEKTSIPHVLEIRKCGVISLDEHSLKGAKFSKFEARNNIYPIVNNYTFNQTLGLQKINLDYNQIEIVTQKAFANAGNVTDINLSYNKIHMLIEGTFECSGLKVLWLTNNRLKALADNTFKGAFLLEDLALFDNKIEKVSKEAFHGLNSLRKLQLDNNKIDFLEEGTFRHNPNLKTLSLNSNFMQILSKNIFLECKSVATISIMNNAITAISRHTFADCDSLTYLFLQNNMCTSKHWIDSHTNMMHKEKLLLECFENYRNISEHYEQKGGDIEVDAGIGIDEDTRTEEIEENEDDIEKEEMEKIKENEDKGKYYRNEKTSQRHSAIFKYLVVSFFAISMISVIIVGSCKNSSFNKILRYTKNEDIETVMIAEYEEDF